jgi:ribosomal protein S18 acetylase RimI-like enzyme
MSITIRRAIIADAAAILELNAAYNDLRATQSYVEQYLASSSQYETPFVAEIGGHVVGLACLRLIPCLCDPIPTAELTELIVHPTARRLGVGSALIQHIEQVAHMAGATQLTLMTAWRNTDAHAFYHALGYRLYTIMMQRSLLAESAVRSAD